MERLYYVYMMANVNNRVLYTGVTNNLVRRVYEHKKHLVKGFTSRYNCEKLVFYEACGDIRIAIETEKRIKGWSRAKKNALVESMNPNWEELFDYDLSELAREYTS